MSRTGSESLKIGSIACRAAYTPARYACPLKGRAVAGNSLPGVDLLSMPSNSIITQILAKAMKNTIFLRRFFEICTANIYNCLAFGVYL